MDKSIILLALMSMTLFEALGQITLSDFQNLYCSYSTDSKLVSLKKELNLRNYNSLRHGYFPSYSFSLSPNYSESISPITQPDGTIKNHNIHNFSLSPSISANFPLLFSGGTISASSSIGYYRNIDYANSYSNISVNFFSIHISQPLSFFRSSKWGLRNVRASYEISSVEVIQDYLKVKSAATSLYFNFLNLTTNISNIEKQIIATDSVITILQSLYKAGKILSPEVDEARIDAINKRIYLKKLNIQLNALKEELSVNTGDNSYIFMAFSFPPIPELNTDFNEMKGLLCQKQEYLKEAIMFSYKYSIEEAKNNRNLMPTLQASIGNNGAGDSMHQAFENRRMSYNISVGFSLPISQLKETKNKLEIARLNYIQKQEQISKSNMIEQARLNETFSLFQTEKDNLAALYEAKNIYKKESEISFQLLSIGKIMFDDYKIIKERQLKNELDIVTSVWNLYKYIDRIEEILLYDIENRISYIPTQWTQS